MSIYNDEKKHINNIISIFSKSFHDILMTAIILFLNNFPNQATLRYNQRAYDLEKEFMLIYSFNYFLNQIVRFKSIP